MFSALCTRSEIGRRMSAWTTSMSPLASVEGRDGQQVHPPERHREHRREENDGPDALGHGALSKGRDPHDPRRVLEHLAGTLGDKQRRDRTGHLAGVEERVFQGFERA